MSEESKLSRLRIRLRKRVSFQIFLEEVERSPFQVSIYNLILYLAATPLNMRLLYFFVMTLSQNLRVISIIMNDMTDKMF